MVIKQNILFFSAFLIITLSGCKSTFSDKKFNQGIINFEITYPNTEEGNILAGMLPNEMTLKFRENNLITEFSAGMGLVKIALIANADSGKISQMLKIMNKKYVYSVDSSRASELYETLPMMTVKLTDETKEVAGYKCKKAIVTFQGKLQETINIYYTDEINVSNPNWCTPFSTIQGVMLEYQINKYNIEMKFTAKSIVNTPIDSTEFMVPSDYVFISKDEMDKLFESFKQTI